MGVLNVTPDSFSDGGRFREREPRSRRRAAWSTRAPPSSTSAANPRAPAPSRSTSSEELARVIPVIEALAANRRVFISVDTSKPEVMRAAVEAGADIINDVRALRSRARWRPRRRAAPASA